LFEKLQHLSVLNLVGCAPDRRAFAFFGGVHEVFVIGQAASVREQVANGDGFSVGGEIGEDLGERGVVAELAVVD